MKTLGRGSLAWLLYMLLNIARIVLVAVTALLVLVLLVLVLHYMGVRFPASVNAEFDEPWPVMALAFSLAAVWIVTAFIVLNRLRRIFATLTNGDPFVPENADHLRMVAAAIAVFEGARYIAALVGVGLDASSDEVNLSGGIEFNLAVWFGVLSLIVLAEVFREGARLRQEQKLTI